MGLPSVNDQHEHSAIGPLSQDGAGIESAARTGDLHGLAVDNKSGAKGNSVPDAPVQTLLTGHGAHYELVVLIEAHNGLGAGKPAVEELAVLDDDAQGHTALADAALIHESAAVDGSHGIFLLGEVLHPDA